MKRKRREKLTREGGNVLDPDFCLEWERERLTWHSSHPARKAEEKRQSEDAARFAAHEAKRAEVL